MTVPETVPKPIVRRTGDVLGYARVSTADQDAAGQHDRLEGSAQYASSPTSSPAHRPIGRSWPG